MDVFEFSLIFQAISAGLSEFCIQHNPMLENSSGWLHSFTSMVGSIGSIFATDENGKNESLWYVHSVLANSKIFYPIYAFVYGNR